MNQFHLLLPSQPVSLIILLYASFLSLLSCWCSGGFAIKILYAFIVSLLVTFYYSKNIEYLLHITELLVMQYLLFLTDFIPFWSKHISGNFVVRLVIHILFKESGWPNFKSKHNYMQSCYIQWKCDRVNVAYDEVFIIVTKTIGTISFLMLHMWKAVT